MLNYTKKTIINTSTVDGQNRFMYDNGKLRILRVGDYKASCIVNGRVFKTTSVLGKYAKVTWTPTATIAVGKGGTYSFQVDVVMNQKFMSDYANAAFRYRKPIYVEVELPDGTTVANQIAIVAKALKLTIPSDYKFITISSTATKLDITANDTYQIFKNAKVQRLIDTAYVVTSEDVTGSTMAIVQGQPEFGTADYLIENHKLPTYENVRYMALNSDENPVQGGTYTQYVFEYSVQRGISGMGSVGQQLVSKTTHVFYVLEGAVASAFEAVLTEAGLGFDAIADADSTNETFDNASLTLTGTDVIAVAGTSNLKAVWNKPSLATKYTITYVSKNTPVATVVSGTGVVTGVAKGNAQIVATAVLKTDSNVKETATFLVTVE